MAPIVIIYPTLRNRGKRQFQPVFIGKPEEKFSLNKALHMNMQFCFRYYRQIALKHCLFSGLVDSMSEIQNCTGDFQITERYESPALHILTASMNKKSAACCLQKLRAGSFLHISSVGRGSTTEIRRNPLPRMAPMYSVIVYG